ncbi:MAG TPA: hypothetical protein VJT75_08120 [Thermoleophilaceae bacterium]|nr:hypothetical protein [Thermoleophilaceae bacterium]
MAIELVSETFANRIGEAFEAVTASAEGRLDLVLSECEESPHGPPEELREQFGRVPFSLIFHAPERDRYAPQQTFTLRHPELGEFELFMVPLGPDERGMQYQAVIS